MSKELEKDVETLKKDIGKFREDLADMLSDVGNLSQDKVRQTRANLKLAMEALEGRAAEKIGQANDILHEQSERALKASRETIMERPLTTVAISFGAGILTAMLMERSRK
jgi:ElaB/YqjD/DUF883 family membrane-anchored ribosome-binding protein